MTRTSTTSGNNARNWIIGGIVAALIALGATLAQWPFHAYDQLFTPPQPTAPTAPQILKAGTTEPGKTLMAFKPSVVTVNVINGVGPTGTVEIYAPCPVGSACGSAYYEQINGNTGFVVSGSKVLYLIELDTVHPLNKTDPQIDWVALPAGWQDITKLSTHQRDDLLKVMTTAVAALHKTPETTNVSQIVNLPYGIGIVTAGDTDQNYWISQIGNQ